MQRGGSSKDTWVISETPVEEITLLHASSQNVELRRTGNNLPSRLADNFFWLGRYSERADATARLLRSALRRFNPERDRRGACRCSRRCCKRSRCRASCRALSEKAGTAAERRGVRGGIARGDF